MRTERVFRTPSCPNCGSAYLVIERRLHGSPRRTSGRIEKKYRCFRCFHGFSEDDVEPPA
ncbi:hypothetical protein CK500_09030 [Halorubrum salipaludis]|uniref:Uncharacterized protein n=1 Tax=Halorubrum salipaludis TaxID=2032630 RepID=A0A2A2FFA1_9EURY|nr:hypothetical protein CK500_09030 [Halorubrum salipaludis]